MRKRRKYVVSKERELIEQQRIEEERKVKSAHRKGDFAQPNDPRIDI